MVTDAIVMWVIKSVNATNCQAFKCQVPWATHCNTTSSQGQSGKAMSVLKEFNHQILNLGHVNCHTAAKKPSVA
jgi:hypothetical protein